MKYLPARISVLVATSALLVSAAAYGEDMGFRYVNGRCINAKGQPGLNPDYVGECGAVNGANLSGQDLSNISLKAAVFKNVTLRQTNLSGSSLQLMEITNCEFDQVILDGADLTQAGIYGGKITQSTLKNIVLVNAIISDLSISKSDLTQSTFAGAYTRGLTISDSNLSAASLTGATLIDVDFSGSSLAGANLENVAFNGSNFAGTDLSKANLGGITGEDLDFSTGILNGTFMGGARLTSPNFTGVSASGLNLSASVLQSARFDGASLPAAQFNNADLSGSSFTKANLANANFTEAKIAGSDLSDVTGPSATFLNARITKSKLDRISLDGSVLSSILIIESSMQSASATKAKVDSAILRKVSLKGAAFVGSDLSGLQADQVDVMGANFSNVRLSLADLSNTTNAEKATWKNARISKRTKLPFSNDRAIELGMLLSKVPSVLIIWDSKTDTLPMIKTLLEENDSDVTMSTVPEVAFTGEGLAGVDAVLHLNASSYSEAMTEEGQKALVSFVKAGGTYLTFGWSSYEMFYFNTGVKGLRDLVLFDLSTTDGNLDVTLSKIPKMNHPALVDIPDTFATKCGYGERNKLHAFESDPAKVILEVGEYGAVAVRSLGKGTAINFFNSLNYEPYASTAECLKSNEYKATIVGLLNYYYKK